MSAPQRATDHTFYMTEIPLHLEKAEVTKILKEKLKLDGEYILTTGNFLTA